MKEIKLSYVLPRYIEEPPYIHYNDTKHFLTKVKEYNRGYKECIYSSKKPELPIMEKLQEALYENG
jgi:hypothetical protein